MPWSTRFPMARGFFAQGRHQAECWDFFGDVIHGAKGSAALGEGVSDPRIYQRPSADARERFVAVQGQALQSLPA